MPHRTSTSTSSLNPASEEPTLDRLTILKLLDRGQRGKIYLVRDTTDKSLGALRVVPRVWSSACSAIMKEQAILREVGELGVGLGFCARMKASWYDEGYFYVLTDYCPGGELSLELARRKKFDEDRVRFYAAQLVLALQSLHEARIIYRALSLQNVLIDTQGNATLASFASACSFEDDFDGQKLTSTERAGSPHYMSPEVHDGKEYSYEIDFWSLGVILYQMLTGRLPFGNDLKARDPSLPQRIKQDTIPFSKADKLSDSAGRFIRHLLEKDPSKRLSSISQIKNHAFFSSINWAEVEDRVVPSPWVPAVPKDPAHPLCTLPQDRYNIIDTTPVPSFVYPPVEVTPPPSPPAPSSPLQVADQINVPSDARAELQPSSPNKSQIQEQLPPSPSPAPSLTLAKHKQHASQIIPRPPPIKSVAFALPRRESSRPISPDSSTYSPQSQMQYQYWHSSHGDISEPHHTVPVLFLCKILSLVLPRPWKLWFQHTDEETDVTCSTMISSPPSSGSRKARKLTRTRTQSILPQHVDRVEDYVVVEPRVHSAHPGLDISRSLSSSYVNLESELRGGRTLRNQSSSETLVGSVDSMGTVADDSTYGSAVHLVKSPLAQVQQAQTQMTVPELSSGASNNDTGKVSRLLGWFQGLVGWSNRPSPASESSQG